MRSALAAAFLFAPFAFGQMSSPPVDVPAADPARPTVTSPAHIPPPGYLQFEQGFVEAYDSPGLVHQFGVLQTTKVSLTHRLMIQVQGEPFVRTKISADEFSNDTADLALGTQVLFTDEKEGHSLKPTIALGYNRRVRTGTSPDLDIGSFAQGALLLVSGDIRGIHYDTNFAVNENVDGTAAGPAIRRAQFGETVALTRAVSAKVSLTGEVWHFTQPFVHSTRDNQPSTRSSATGLVFSGGYTVRPTIVLDAGFSHGVTATSTNWQGFAGFTYLLPHRLWPARRK